MGMLHIRTFRADSDQSVELPFVHSRTDGGTKYWRSHQFSRSTRYPETSIHFNMPPHRVLVNETIVVFGEASSDMSTICYSFLRIRDRHKLGELTLARRGEDYYRQEKRSSVDLTRTHFLEMLMSKTGTLAIGVCDLQTLRLQHTIELS